MPGIVAVFFWVLLCCAAAGFAIWLLTQFVKDPTVLKIGRVVIVVLLVVVLFWLIIGFVGMPPMPQGRGHW
jgi:hypothetical protein